MSDLILSDGGALVTGGDAAIWDAVTAEVLRGLADSSRVQYRHTFSLWAAFVLDGGAGSMLDLRADTVEAFLDREWTKSTKQRHLATLRGMADKLVDWSLGQNVDQAIINQLAYRANTMKSIKLRRKENKRGKRRPHNVLRQSEVAKLLAPPDPDDFLGVRWSALVALGVLCGLRADEMLSLKWQDIGKSVVTIHAGKGDKSRKVHLFTYQGEKLIQKRLDLLRGHIPTFEYVFTPSKPFDHNEPSADVQLGYRPALHQHQQRCTALNIQAQQLHDLRHTAITQMAEAGLPVHILQQVAGHSKVETTMIYVAQAEAADLVARYPLYK